MGLSYIKVKPEKAIEELDKCIVQGYQTKDKIRGEYYSNKELAPQKLSQWRSEASKWLSKTIERLGKVFVSQKELYNFRDATPPFGATSENVQFVGIVSTLKARIDKLNEYDSYIRKEFNIKIEVVGRDKITQLGSGHKVEIKNEK